MRVSKNASLSWLLVTLMLVAVAISNSYASPLSRLMSQSQPSLDRGNSLDSGRHFVPRAGLGLNDETEGDEEIDLDQVEAILAQLRDTEPLTPNFRFGSYAPTWPRPRMPTAVQSGPSKQPAAKRALSLFAHWRTPYASSEDGPSGDMTAVTRGEMRSVGRPLRWG
ncbi:hypothetical protein HDE_08484 [Halotydeus destructor]|nr:hypothetical protein HDE_08484 [Halotydeus destructor]